MSSVDLRQPLRALAEQVQGGLLALDAATAVGSLCVVAPSGGVHERELDASSMPSESLVAAIEDGLEAAALTVRDLRLLAVGLGPGSFTGLRVALATVKGIAYGAGLPIYGFSSLALLAGSAGTGLVVPVLDARRGDLFCALYEVEAGGTRITSRLEDAARSAAELADLLAPFGHSVRLVGSAAAAHPELRRLGATPPLDLPRPRAAMGLLVARDRIAAGRAEDLAALTPRYLRASEAERLAGVAD